MRKIYIFNLQTSKIRNDGSRPEWFSLEKCFKNLLDTTINSFCDVNIIFDGTVEQDHYINKYTNKFLYKVYSIDSMDNNIEYSYNNLIFKKIQDILQIKKAQPDDLVMTAEFDYLYLPHWTQCILDLYGTNLNYNIKNTYVSLWDHLDKMLFNKPDSNDHNGMYKNLTSKIYCGKFNYWRTTPSTCNSFIMTKELFDKDFDILSLPMADNGRFEILNKRERQILSPMPSLSCHMNKFFLAPFIDWKALNDSIVCL